MKKALVLLLCLSVCLVLACTAPGEGSKPAASKTASKAASDGGRNVTFVLKNLVNPFCVTVQEGAMKAAKDFNVNLTMLTPMQADNSEEMIQLTETALASGKLNGYIIFTSDSLAVVPAVRKVHQAKIPVVICNTMVRPQDPKEIIYDSFVVAENWQVGRAMGNALADKLGGKGNVIIIEGVAGAQNSIDRCGGAKEALLEHPGIKIVASQNGNLNRAVAMQVMQNLLQTYPNVDGIYAMNDEMALGCIEAIEAAGKAGKIIVAGTDGNKDARQAIRDGKLTLSCDILPYQQGYQSVATIAKLLDKQPVEKLILVNMKVLDKNNVDETAN